MAANGRTRWATGSWLPYLRLGTAAGLCALAVGWLQLGVTGENLNEGFLVLARNVIGITGIGLLCSLVTRGPARVDAPDGVHGVLPVRTARSLDRPVDLAGPAAADCGAWICATAVLAAGLWLLTIRGPRIRLSDDG
jgi:hypothetical protein